MAAAEGFPLSYQSETIRVIVTVGYMVAEGDFQLTCQLEKFLWVNAPNYMENKDTVQLNFQLNNFQPKTREVDQRRRG